jgi:pimeloyl-ACP methyl ester carboxylesterase
LAGLFYKFFPLGSRILSPFYAKDWNRWYKMFEQDLSHATLESFHYSIASLRHTDLRPRLNEIQVPILGVYGRIDRIVSPKQRHVLEQSAPMAEISYFEGSGHFPMLDEPERFYETLTDFVARQPDQGLAVREGEQPLNVC